MKKVIKIIVLCLMGLAFVGAVLWAVFIPDFEPVITSIALLASIIAIYIDKWISSVDQRKAMLKVLLNELYMNAGVLKDLKSLKTKEKVNKIHVYPRFYTTSLTSAIASGIFVGEKDKNLWKLMNGWLQNANEYNHRLDISEIQVFSAPTTAKVFNMKVTEGVIAINAILKYRELVTLLMDRYHSETDIDFNTVLFEDE